MPNSFCELSIDMSNALWRETDTSHTSQTGCFPESGFRLYPSIYSVATASMPCLTNQTSLSSETAGTHVCHDHPTATDIGRRGRTRLVCTPRPPLRPVVPSTHPPSPVLSFALADVKHRSPAYLGER